MVFKIFNGKVKEWRYAGHDKKIKEWIYAGRKSKKKCKVFISSFSKTLVYNRVGRFCTFSEFYAKACCLLFL